MNDDDCLIEENAIGSAAVWYFEPAGNYYRIYTYVGSKKKYIHKKSRNTIELSENASDLIEISVSKAGDSFYFKKKDDNKWLQHSNGGGIRYYTDKNNAANARMKLYYNNRVSIPDNFYDLDGKTYGLMNYTGGTHGYALMADHAAQNVHSLVELVTHQTADAKGITLYVDEGSEITRCHASDVRRNTPDVFP